VDPGDSVVSQVIVRDIISLLSPYLCSRGNAVLECLADGLGVREIGRRLEMSHTMVIRHRSKIASLLLRLERPSFLRKQFRRANGLRTASRPTASGTQTEPTSRMGPNGQSVLNSAAIQTAPPNHASFQQKLFRQGNVMGF